MKDREKKTQGSEKLNTKMNGSEGDVYEGSVKLKKYVKAMKVKAAEGRK